MQHIAIRMETRKIVQDLKYEALGIIGSESEYVNVCEFLRRPNNDDMYEAGYIYINRGKRKTKIKRSKFFRRKFQKKNVGRNQDLNKESVIYQ